MSKLAETDRLFEAKRKLAIKMKLEKIPNNIEVGILAPELKSEFDLVKKPVRVSSGIAVVTVMTKPFACPHGTCVFCPGGIRLGTPQSYTVEEPATKFAAASDYDPAKQVVSRLSHLSKMGHDTSKVEVVVVGGTFPSYPKTYRIHFVKSIFDSLNGRVSSTIDQALSENESAMSRCVGLTVETKPEYCFEEDVDQMLLWGVTRVEIGVQVLSDQIYKLVNRGHTVHDVEKAFQVSRDSGIKVNAHMMLGLPRSTTRTDLQSFQRMFEDERFKPDMLKIYPTLVVKGTELAEWYENGRYAPYSIEDLIDLICEIKRKVPPWVRIMRIQREIGSKEIIAGPRCSNLRQIVKERMKVKGYTCRCIRCREIRLTSFEESSERAEPELDRVDYSAANGREIFLSYVLPNDRLVGFIRLRIPSDLAHRTELKETPTGFIRELHVYGKVAPIGSRTNIAWQHRGFGGRLLSSAEEIAKREFGMRKLLVTSAVGTRNYYRKFGYERLGPYMSKNLN